jgi:hypothetical protein
MMVDKILIANFSALKRKYGISGRQRIRVAINGLIAKDHSRKLQTQLIDISSQAQMQRYDARAVYDARNERQNKDAVDAVYAALKPHYMVLMDGPDVIPHIRLINPTPADKDENVPSDLPFASDAPLTTRSVAAYAAVTRVVGRIPGITAATEPSFIIGQIRNAARYTMHRRVDYLDYFGMSAYAWRKSTERSVDNIFHATALNESPPKRSPLPKRAFAPLTHFINCHGGETNPTFYGQRGTQYPILMTSDDIAQRVRRNTIVAAECCFGAQLFDPAKAHGKLPISNAYLHAGAVAFFGSTTTAYGASQRSVSADLICQYFLMDILAGASTGRACLQARQKFVFGQKMEDPVNLKTLAQFVLLGDPSLHPVRDEIGVEDGSHPLVDSEEARRTRRVALVAAGKSAVECSGFPGRLLKHPRTKLYKHVHRIAREKNFKTKLDAVQVYEVVGRHNYANELKARKLKQKVLMVTHHERTRGNKGKGTPLTRILVAHAQNNRITGVVEYIRR